MSKEMSAEEELEILRNQDVEIRKLYNKEWNQLVKEGTLGISSRIRFCIRFSAGVKNILLVGEE